MPTPDYGRRTREYAGLLDRFLESRRSEKFRRFIAKLNAGYVGPNILAEGDSWFEYPYAKDLLVWLGEPYAVLSLAKAGDSFAEVNARKELMPVLVNPPQRKDFHIVMLSLGGNEIMGRVEAFVAHRQHGRPDRIKASFDTMLDEVQSKYAKLIKPIIERHTQHVILHGYDYPDPRLDQAGAQWIGPPLAVELGIEEVAACRAIANEMLNRFNTRLDSFARRPENEGRVHYIRLLETVGSADYRHGPDKAMWADEIHPSDEGFAKVADRVKPVIDDIWRKMQQA